MQDGRHFKGQVQCLRHCSWGQRSWLLAVLSGVFIWDWECWSTVWEDQAWPSLIKPLDYSEWGDLCWSMRLWGGSLPHWHHVLSRKRGLEVHVSNILCQAEGITTLILCKDTAVSFVFIYPVICLIVLKPICVRSLQADTCFLLHLAWGECKTFTKWPSH